VGSFIKSFVSVGVVVIAISLVDSCSGTTSVGVGCQNEAGLECCLKVDKTSKDSNSTK